MYPEGLPKEMSRLSDPLRKEEEPYCLVYYKTESPDVLKLYDLWARLGVQYSRCSLTIDTDRLTAISGIAKSLQQTRRDEYYTGRIRSLQAGYCLDS
jgi:hypothetical protein